MISYSPSLVAELSKLPAGQNDLRPSATFNPTVLQLVSTWSPQNLLTLPVSFSSV